MATSYTRLLRLRISDALTADARYNLEKIDTLGGIFSFDETDTANIRSATNINLLPEDSSVGGSGSGGVITLGSASQAASVVHIYSTTLNLHSSALTGSFTVPWANITLGAASVLSFTDFDTEVSNNTDVAANTTHRSNTSNPHSVTASQVGAYTTAQTDTLLAAKAAASDLSTHTGASSGVHGVTGSVVGTSDSQTLTNKTISASSNTISNIANANISSSAAIAYSKLDLAGSIATNDLAAGLSVPWSKVNKTGSSLADFTTHSHTVLDDIGTNTHAQIDTHIAASSGVHGITGSFVGTSDSQTLTNKTIDAGTNTLSNIANSNISSSAAIAGTKIDPNFGDQWIQTTQGIKMSEGGYTLTLRAAQSGMGASFTLDFPTADGSNGQVLSTNGSGQMSWITAAGTGTLTGPVSATDNAVVRWNGTSGIQTQDSVVIIGDTGNVSGVADLTVTGTTTLATSLSGVVKASSGVLSAATVVNADVSASAAIARTKLASGTAYRILVNDSAGVVSENASLASGRVVITDANGQLEVDGGLRYDAANDRFSVGSGAGVQTVAIAGTTYGMQVSSHVAGATDLFEFATHRHSDSAGLSPVYGNFRSRNTSASPTVVQSGDSIVRFQGAGFDGTDYELAGSIELEVDGTPGAGDMPGRWVFKVSADGAASPAEAMRISANKAVKFSGATNYDTLTASRVPYLDGSKNLATSSVTDTELGYLSGVTSAIQTQLDAITTNLAENAQDAVGNILTDTSSIDFTYTDGGPTISAVVLPAGVDHNSLQNYDANRHVDHTAVSIATAANSGLTGGGTIAATRNLSVDITGTSSATLATGDEFLIYDISASANRKTTAAAITALLGTSAKATWVNADTATKAITHNLGTTDVIVQVYDIDAGQTIEVDEVTRTSANVVTLTASQAPSSGGSGWKVLILALT